MIVTVVVVMAVIVRAAVRVLMAVGPVVVVVRVAVGRRRLPDRAPDRNRPDGDHHQQTDPRPEDKRVELWVQKQAEHVARVHHYGDAAERAADADGAELLDVIGAAVFAVSVIVSHVKPLPVGLNQTSWPDDDE